MPLVDWRNTTKFVNQRKRKLGFVRRLLFGNETTHPQEIVHLTLQQNVLEMAPFTKEGTPALQIGGEWDTAFSFLTPHSRMKRSLDASMLYPPQPVGATTIVDVQELRRQIIYKRTRELSKLPDIMDNAIEWMCCQILGGSISYAIRAATSATGGGQNNLQDWSFALPDTNTMISLAGDLRWNTTPSGGAYGGGADIQADFRQVQRVVADGSGLGVTDAIFGTAAMNAFLKNPNVKADLDRSNYDVGALTLNNGFTEDGVSYVGKYLGVRCWEYNRSVVQWQLHTTNSAILAAGGSRVSASLFNTNRVYFFSASQSAGYGLHFGPIKDLPQMRGEQLQTKYFSKRWTEEDPAVEHHLVASRPLPFVEKTKALQVLAPLA